MERPALRRLLEDVQHGRLDTIVVYKVDRLTRSLADFAKIIEILDSRGVAFVSVTQQFSTTSSMGRLTLNVLLSFAQFEREVTGERIRDKIAASKRKGMWMGGRVPLGYVLKERKLVRNHEEAKHVEQIYRLYLELGCVSKLKARFDADGVKSKIRVSAGGANSGGDYYSRGALYKILQNRVYVGETVHRKQHYPGEHEALIPRELWDRVQGQLRNHAQGHRSRTQSRRSSLLLGLLQDSTGNRYVPSHTVRNGKRYRYYILSGHEAEATDSPKRIPAHEIENLLVANLHSFLNSARCILDQIGKANDPASRTRRLLEGAGSFSRSWHNMPSAQVREFLRNVLRRVVVHEDKVEVLISRHELRAILLADQPLANECPANDAPVDDSSDDVVRLEFTATLRRCGTEMRLLVPAGNTPARTLPSLVKAVARAHDWYERLIEGRVPNLQTLSKQTGLDKRYLSRVFRCCFLAPDIVEAILDGRQPAELTFAKLAKRLPMNWAEQRKALGFCSSEPAK